MDSSTLPANFGGAVRSMSPYDVRNWVCGWAGEVWEYAKFMSP